MVYPGRPSRACATCKTRKIKCDEEKPACSQCRKTSRECPGYRDVIFRDQTEIVARKQQKPKKPRPERKTLLISSNDIHENATSAVVVAGLQTTDQLSMALLSRLSQLKTHAINTSIHAPPWVSIQEQAAHVCFKNFDRLYSTWDAHNILLTLAPLYQASPEGSPLRVSAHAAALCVVAQIPSKRNLRHEAAKAYGKAIRTMATALMDPVQAKSDETLLATLLLSWYETLDASEHSIEAWSNHIEGATAIVRMRGSTQFHDPLGLSLFRATRTEMFINCLRAGTAPVDFPAAGGWLSDTHVGTYDYRDPISHLMLFAVELPSLRWRQRELMQHAPQPATVKEMDSLIDKAHELAKRMAEDNLPDDWRPRTVAYIPHEPEHIKSAKAWAGPVHAYDDIYCASALNKLRSCRILAAELIVNGLAWAHPNDYLQRDQYHQAVYIEQSATNDICSSIPAHFVWAGCGEAPTSGEEEINHTANLIAGYHLHWPLRVARSCPRISNNQRAWIESQLDDIADRCGVQQATLPDSDE